MDGCPDFIADNKGAVDFDRDGIVDNRDLCPNQPETYNNQDPDGCPDYYGMGDRDLDGSQMHMTNVPLQKKHGINSMTKMIVLILHLDFQH